MENLLSDYLEVVKRQMAKDLSEYIKIVKKRNLDVFIYTNGARLIGDYMKSIVDAGIDLIRFSIAIGLIIKLAAFALYNSKLWTPFFIILN